MTVPSQTNRSGPYTGNGVTTVFDYEFKITNENYIKVIKADAAGVETVLTIDADYIVSDVGNPAGGQVALTTPLPTGQTLTMIPSVPFTQEIDLENQGAYYAETVERGLDLAVMRDQQLQEQISRAVLIPPSEDPAQLDGLIGDILRLAGSADEIDTVANNIGAVNTAATNIAAIIAAPAQAAAAAASATASAGSATAAATSATNAANSATGAAGSAAAAAASAAAIDYLAVADRAALKAVNTAAHTVAYLKESGREGVFVWTAGDFSTQVASDTAEGIYAKANAIAATAGAWVRRYSGPAKVEWFGAVGDNATNDTSAIQAALALTGNAVLSEGKTYRTTDTINLTVTKQKLGGKGTLHCNLGNGAAAKPALYIDTTATEAVVSDITVDHDGSTYVDPTAHGGNFIWGSAVFLAADDAKVVNITVKNAWDNGVAICQFAGVGSAIAAGSPKRAKALGVSGFSNGCGNHVAGGIGKQGACVDLASGTLCVVSDCTDNGSSMGFILDIGASGQGVFSNCVSYLATLDAGHPTNGSGLGFYAGGSDSSFVNCHAFFAGLHGWWVDAPANNNTYTGCEAFACQRHGFRIDSGNSAFVGCSARANSQAAANTYDGFALTHTTAKTGLLFHACRGLDAQQRYGFAASPTGGGSIQGEIIGGTFEGATGKILLSNQALAVLYTGVNGGKIGIGHAAPRTMLDVAGPDFAGTTIGDTTNLGQALFGPLSAPNKRVAIGYGTGDDSGIIQSIDAGTSAKPLKLNPLGGAVLAGPGGVGYGTGAGGAIVQATSKSTGVTLNKATGQITLNAAALAAGTVASFVLTNSAIAAGDILVLNHISGKIAEPHRTPPCLWTII